MAKTFQELKTTGKMQADTIRLLVSKMRASVGTRHEDNLNKALAIRNRRDLIDKTLLSKCVRRLHEERMQSRMKKLLAEISVRYKKLVHKEKTLDEHLRKQLRLVTILHQVTNLDVENTTGSANNLLESLDGIFGLLHQNKKRLRMIGSVEIEIINMKMMRDAHSDTNLDDFHSGRRKLKVLEAMIGNNVFLKSQDVLALVHCHGVMDIGSYRDDEIKEELQKWWAIKYQIEVKSLSEYFRGKRKSVDASLKDIASYVTKGANDYIGTGNEKSISLHFKISFDKDMESAEDQMVKESRKAGSLIREESKTDGLAHSKSMTFGEIAFHAQAIDALMGLKSNRMGYLIDL
jgi:hypothetical protein